MNLTVADLLTLLFCSGVYNFALHNIRLSTSSRDILCKILAGNAIVWPLFGWRQLFQVFQIAYGRRIIGRKFFLSWSRYPCMRPWTVEHQPSKVRSYIITHAFLLIVLPSILISFCYISIFAELKSRSSEPDENEDSSWTKYNSEKVLSTMRYPSNDCRAPAVEG